MVFKTISRVLPLCVAYAAHTPLWVSAEEQGLATKTPAQTTQTATISDAVPSADSVRALTQKVADWQIKTFEEAGKYRSFKKKRMQKIIESGEYPEKYHDLVWHNATLYVGMYLFCGIAEDPQKYKDWLRMIADRNDWDLRRRKYHADDHAVGQLYTAFYEEFKDPKMIKATQERFDWILANPKDGSLDWSEEGHRHARWDWCDALFMAPPVWAHLAKVTGESKYLDFMHKEYMFTSDFLFDKEEHLFYRDSRFFKKQEKNGSKVFWGRGNGWVYGGLALMMPHFPENWEHRERYVDIFKKMSVKLKEIQRPDGTWSGGLLGGVEGYPVKETSGTAFFAFGLAWGINNGILDRETYEPTLMKAWNSLADCVTEEGLLGYVQPVGDSPGGAYPDKTEVYGVGAFLAAGAELYKLLK